jgi:hypothetical protein
MAATVSTSTQATPIGTDLYTIKETTTVSDDVAVDTTSGSLLAVEIDNTGNTSVAYLLLYDVAAGSVTVGTTDETFIFMAPASSRITYACPGGATYGTALTAAISSAPHSATGPGVAVTAYVLVST